MKHCYKCLTFKLPTEFGNNKSRKDGLSDECKPCKRQQDREYAARNRKSAQIRASEWYYSNHEYALKRNKINSKKWRKKNPDKHCARQNLRRANKLKATPAWLTEEHKFQIACKYSLAAMLSKNTEEQYHVDHIVPLKGKTICGLHVPWNLQVIPAQENLRKSNKI
jgi:hypothetical protein